ncbi:class I histocompatibility antigen, B alpha chain-like [Latimeria chalumnae]|uniref:class I histocompatibility antigen, B alpha chain-like n=1 Tax=Latimeria chalumnae TaxID=7897 RepID=UPI00313AD90F
MYVKYAQNYQERYRYRLQELLHKFNCTGARMEGYAPTRGVNIYQRRSGCEMDADGNKTRGFNVHSYNGKDYIEFDTETQKWKASSEFAETQEEDNNKNTALCQKSKEVLDRDCISFLKKCVDKQSNSSKKSNSP